MSPRPYRSSRRRLAAERTRARLLKAASATLADREVISLDAVAKVAGVTRLTVYNQFGSRRAVLEAVFDQVALRGGLHRLADALALADPHAAVRQTIGIFCDFWSFDPGALGLLHAAGSTNQEFAASVTERNERRRKLFAAIIRRLELRPKRQRDLVDVLFALTTFPFFPQLTTAGPTAPPAAPT